MGMMPTEPFIFAGGLLYANFNTKSRDCGYYRRQDKN